MSPETVTAYLGLGSNLGDRQQNLERALDLLRTRLRIIKVSSVYDTEPVGTGAQPRFLNLVCEVRTSLSPENLLALAKGIERKLGRHGKSGAPRPIDIDILLYDELTMETPDLTVPHPRIAERAFALVPLSEIAPEALHPPSGMTIEELLLDLRHGRQGVLKWNGG